MKELLVEENCGLQEFTNSKAIDTLEKYDKTAILAHDHQARRIQEFLWEGRPKRSKRREHTVEEYNKFLEQIAKYSWDAYNGSIEKELGL